MDRNMKFSKAPNTGFILLLPFEKIFVVLYNYFASTRPNLSRRNSV